MELEYFGKKSKSEILKLAEAYANDIDIVNDGSILIFGENFKALSTLIKNGFANKIDLIYIDPPYNTKQNFYMTDDRRNAISAKKNGYLAYSDKFTFENYLEFIRERLVLIRELLSDKGSLYFHIDTKMGHYCKVILDEIFGKDNFKNDITRIKSNPKNFARRAYGNEKDLILFYAKNAQNAIWNDFTEPLKDIETSRFNKCDERGRYTTIPLHAPGETKDGVTGKCWRGMLPPPGRHWRTDPKEFDKMDAQGLIEWSKNGNPRIKKYISDHKGKKIQDVWEFKDPQYPVYPTQKNEDLLKRIIMQSTEDNSVILDCFAGSGTTLKAAEKLGRRWIGVDNSEQAINIMHETLSDKFQSYQIK